jgi:hypothetical protein
MGSCVQNALPVSTRKPPFQATCSCTLSRKLWRTIALPRTHTFVETMAPLAVRKEPLLRFVLTSWKVSNRCPSRAYNTTVQLRSPAGLGANEAASAAAAAAKTARDAEAASAAAAKTARDAEAITAAAMAAAEAAAEAAAAAAAVAGGTPAAAVNANTAAAQWSGHNIHIKRQPRQRHGKVCSPCSRLQFTIGLTPRPRPQGMPSSDAPIADHYQFTPGPYEY